MQRIGSAQYLMRLADCLVVTGRTSGAGDRGWCGVSAVVVVVGGGSGVRLLWFASRAARQWEGELLLSAIVARHDA